MTDVLVAAKALSCTIISSCCFGIVFIKDSWVPLFPFNYIWFIAINDAVNVLLVVLFGVGIRGGNLLKRVIVCLVVMQGISGSMPKLVTAHWISENWA